MRKDYKYYYKNTRNENANNMSKDKGKPIFGLKKIKTADLLRASRFELGQLKSYVQELEYKVGVLEKERNAWLSLDKKERKEKRNELFQQQEYKELSKKLEELTVKYKKLKNDYDILLSKFIYSKNSYENK